MRAPSTLNSSRRLVSSLATGLKKEIICTDATRVPLETRKRPRVFCPVDAPSPVGGPCEDPGEDVDAYANPTWVRQIGFSKEMLEGGLTRYPCATGKCVRSGHDWAFKRRVNFHNRAPRAGEGQTWSRRAPDAAHCLCESDTRVHSGGAPAPRIPAKYQKAPITGRRTRKRVIQSKDRDLFFYIFFARARLNEN